MLVPMLTELGATAEDLEKNNERIRSMQEQISATYEQIRSEQAQQLHLQSQILQRTSGKTDATSSRAETMLESALKQARADVIAAAIDRVVVRARRPRARRALASASTEARAPARAEGPFPPFTTHNAHSRMPSDAIKCETAKG